MSSFELLSVVLSAIAVLVSLVVWNGQRKLQREANDLQKLTADLSKKQLQLINREEAQKQQAMLSLKLIKEAAGYKLILSNSSAADALAVDLRPASSTASNSFLIERELKEKFPHKRLRSGEQIRLIAAVVSGTPFVSEFHVTWQNPDGSTANEDFTVSL